VIVIDADEGDIATVVANRKCNFTTIDVKSQGNIRFAVWVSFGEIYNEQIFDLLLIPPSKKIARRPVLQLREDKHGRPYIKGVLLLLAVDLLDYDSVCLC